MAIRLIDLMCDRHRAGILANRLWPSGFELGNRSWCADCRVASQWLSPQVIFPIIPGVDSQAGVAFHEAGHAVVHLANGIRPATAVITRDADNGGWSGQVSLEVPTTQLGSPKFLAGTLAGVVAQERWLRQLGRHDDAAVVDLLIQAISDMEMAWKYGDADDLDAARFVADDLVIRRWPAIERVAAALLAQGRLTGDEVADLAGIAAPAGMAVSA